MDSATPRTIRIGKSTIGLIGIDVALNQAAAKNLSEDDAVIFLFEAVSKKNYIPPAAHDSYREALRKAYHQHLHPDEQNGDILVFRIFGKTCVSCDNLQKMVIEEKNRDILDSINYASRLQTAMLPARDRIAAFFKQYKKVLSDFKQ